MRYQLLPIAAACLLIAGSCKKEVINWIEEKPDPVTDTVTTLADSRIVTFKVATADAQGIYASVNDTKKEITVYLPSYYSFSFIEPEIALPDGATITPAATELVPVFTETPFTYTVTGKSKEKSVYTVKTIVQQPKLVINELSTATTPKVYSFATTVYIDIVGQNLIPSGNISSMQVLDAAGNVKLSGLYYEQIESSATIKFSLSGADAKTAGLVNGQDYWIQVKCYALKTKTNYPVRFSNIPQ